MIELFLAFLLALTNPAHNGTNGSYSGSGQVTTMDTGGDTGDIPPTPPGGH